MKYFFKDIIIFRDKLDNNVNYILSELCIMYMQFSSAKIWILAPQLDPEPAFFFGGHVFNPDPLIYLCLSY